MSDSHSACSRYSLQLLSLLRRWERLSRRVSRWKSGRGRRDVSLTVMTTFSSFQMVLLLEGEQSTDLKLRFYMHSYSQTLFRVSSIVSFISLSLLVVYIIIPSPILFISFLYFLSFFYFPCLLYLPDTSAITPLPGERV